MAAVEMEAIRESKVVEAPAGKTSMEPTEEATMEA